LKWGVGPSPFYLQVIGGGGPFSFGSHPCTQGNYDCHLLTLIKPPENKKGPKGTYMAYCV